MFQLQGSIRDLYSEFHFFLIVFLYIPIRLIILYSFISFVIIIFEEYIDNLFGVATIVNF